MSVPVRLWATGILHRTQEGRQYGISLPGAVKSGSDWDPPRIEPGSNTPLDGEEIIFDAEQGSTGMIFPHWRDRPADDGRWMLYLVDTR